MSFWPFIEGFSLISFLEPQGPSSSGPLSSPAWRTILKFFDINRRCTDLQWHSRAMGWGKTCHGFTHVKPSLNSGYECYMPRDENPSFFHGQSKVSNPRVSTIPNRKKTLILAPQFGPLLFVYLVYTPGKINMEPENTPLEKEKHLPNHHFQVLC